MAAPSLPSGGVTLHGVGDRVEEGKANSASAVLLKVSDGMLQDIRKAAQARDGLQFVTGSTPVRLPYPPSLETAGAERSCRNSVLAAGLSTSLSPAKPSETSCTLLLQQGRSQTSHSLAWSVTVRNLSMIRRTQTKIPPVPMQP